MSKKRDELDGDSLGAKSYNWFDVHSNHIAVQILNKNDGNWFRGQGWEAFERCPASKASSNLTNQSVSTVANN